MWLGQVCLIAWGQARTKHMPNNAFIFQNRSSNRDFSAYDIFSFGCLISYLFQEIALLSQFEHENIVRYLGTDKVMLLTFIEFAF